MPTFRTPLQITSEYDGESSSSITVPLTGAQVGDTVVVLHGIDNSNNSNNSNGILPLTGVGITPTSRTTLAFSGVNHNAAFVAVSTAVVTDAAAPSFTAGSGDRSASIIVAWAVLPGAWTFVSAATTGTSTTQSNTITSPALAAAVDDTWFGCFQSQWQSNIQWSLPAGTSGGVHRFGITDEGAAGACWEDLDAADISAGQVAARTATKTGTARSRCAAAVVMRPPAAPTPPPGQFMPFFAA